jgi:polysaccharide biosynthesis transport protein
VLVGLLIGLGLAFLLERMDSRIKGPDDLEEIYRAPLLGVAPLSSALARRGKHGDGKGAALSPAETEAFNLIRAHLRFFNVDHDLRTIAIGSASPSDGKTTIARHLAEAAAMLGGRVLLLEADLRQPTLTQQLGLPAGPGLADVLIGAISMEDGIQQVEMQASSGPELDRHRLDVLPAGSMRPPNPGELVESRAMGEVLERAKLRYDLVVIDTPPLTAVSDGLALLSRVDGLILVGWVEHSPRDAAVRLRRVLESSDAPVLGVVANGAKSGAATPYPSSADTQLPAVPTSTAPSHNGASVNGDPESTAIDPRVRT